MHSRDCIPCPYCSIDQDTYHRTYVCVLATFYRSLLTEAIYRIFSVYVPPTKEIWYLSALSDITKNKRTNKLILHIILIQKYTLYRFFSSYFSASLHSSTVIQHLSRDLTKFLSKDCPERSKITNSTWLAGLSSSNHLLPTLQAPLSWIMPDPLGSLRSALSLEGAIFDLKYNSHLQIRKKVPQKWLKVWRALLITYLDLSPNTHLPMITSDLGII